MLHMMSLVFLHVTNIKRSESSGPGCTIWYIHMYTLGKVWFLRIGKQNFTTLKIKNTKRIIIKINIKTNSLETALLLRQQNREAQM